MYIALGIIVGGNIAINVSCCNLPTSRLDFENKQTQNQILPNEINMSLISFFHIYSVLWLNKWIVPVLRHNANTVMHGAF